MTVAVGTGGDRVGNGPGPSGSRLALAGLVGVVLVWGWSYTLVHDAVAVMPAADLTALRLTLAAVVVLVVRPSAVRQVDPRVLRHGVVLGVLLGGALLAQAVGLETTSPGVSAFVTALAAVVAALGGAVLLRRRPPRALLATVVLATAGAVPLVLGAGPGPGAWLTLLCALGLGLHLLALGAWAGEHDLWALVLVQLVVAATLCAVVGAPGGIEAPPDGGSWLAVVVTAVLATVAATAVQRWAQERVDDRPAALTLALEPVAALVVALLLADQTMTWQLALGGACVLVATVLVERAQPVGG